MLSVFWVLPILIEVWYLIVVLISCSLMIYDVEYFSHAYNLCIFGRFLFISFCPFFNQVVYFLLLSFEEEHDEPHSGSAVKTNKI